MPIVLPAPQNLIGAPMPPQVDEYQVTSVTFVTPESATPQVLVEYMAGKIQPDGSVKVLYTGHVTITLATAIATVYSGFKAQLYTYLQNQGLMPAGTVS